MKFGSKLQNIFFTKKFSFDQILYRFISLITKIFWTSWILQLPRLEYLKGLGLYDKY
jgi:hypothetical protein